MSKIVIIRCILESHGSGKKNAGKWGGGVEGLQKRLVLAAVLAAVILAGSTYAFWQKNTAAETTAAGGGTKDSMALAEAKGEIVIYINGAVNQPGVVRVPAGTRVIDAINLAGGLASGADVNKLNLAQNVKDGMHIFVPGGIVSATGAAGSGGGVVNGNRVNINTADKAELDKLPGIGPALAQRIVDYRQANGLFKDPAELKKVQGISESKYNKLKDIIGI
ncbi:MAG: ComEA family DNA-binding protein [Veillonellales bacterium]